MNEYRRYVYEHATYLTRYKLYKLLHDFTVEETIALDYLKHNIVYVETVIEQRKACEVFVHQINLVMAYAHRSYELIVAQAGIYIPFDIENVLIDAWKVKKERIAKRFNQYFGRSINLLLPDAEDRDEILLHQTQLDALIKELDGYEKNGDGREAQSYLNDEMELLFDKIRKVRANWNKGVIGVISVCEYLNLSVLKSNAHKIDPICSLKPQKQENK